MPGETAFAKVSKHEFFAILGSGSYLVGCCGLVYAAWSSGNPDLTPPGAVRWLGSEIEGHWPIAVAALFVAFLIGNLLRALPVNGVDNLWQTWWSWKRKWLDVLRRRLRKPKKKDTPYESALRASWFPYPEMLLLELESMKKSILLLYPLVHQEIQRELEFAHLTKDCARLPEIWHSTYNCWKAELCRESADNFEYTQELEGRVRLFASMIWASMLGFLVGFVGLLPKLGNHLGTNRVIFILTILIPSAVISFIFGSYLRRVRGQEVAAVFIAHVMLKLSNYRRQLPQRPIPPDNEPSDC